MNVDPLSPLKFGAQYGRDYPNATDKIEEAYEEYKDFYLNYHRDNPTATTDCYTQYLQTLEEQQGEEFEYCYWFCAILQERQLVLVGAELDRSRARFIPRYDTFGVVGEVVAVLSIFNSDCQASLSESSLECYQLRKERVGAWQTGKIASPK
ncbi:hypothetical protein G9A89_016300 [Geosiphon pyriformis]|nr:hypothetical protein G9A89_016300 [Geosiphon pyriformis]